MPQDNQNAWLSAYLYYNEPWEKLLTDSVEPYIQTVLDTGIAQQFFFIRYWDRGPHIRLRFKAEAKVISEVLRANVEEHFLGYFDMEPSQRTEPNYPDLFPEAYRWFPNNSVQFIEYKPETDRYGGVYGQLIAEQHFHLSSLVVLQSLSLNARKWTYDDAMGTAIKFHLSFVHAIGLDLQKACGFFHFVFYNWLPHSFNYLNKKLSNQAYQQQTEETIEAFTSAFELQRDSLVPFHEALWEALEAGATFEEDLLNDWVSGNRHIHFELTEKVKAGQLVSRPVDLQLSALPGFLNVEEQQMWMFYADLLHMTNNRLGILNKDEGYLAYLMLRSLKTLIGKHAAEQLNLLL